MKEFVLFLIAYILVVVLTPVAFVLNIIRKAILGHSIKDYIFTASIGFDQAGGSILYEQENWTISSFTYYLCAYKKNKYACMFMRFINFIFGKEHCKRSYIWEITKDSEDLENVIRKV
ncbi:hypothetical protein [Nitrosophilus kaiyonis]|uniref:hypothetical protein n=1 Tax=Nitrosophilus kaiyonis TaxID=2930200 RepID=UPI002490D69B|nr:hypothetical protein [Nitrosophilus kaiyonis]